MSPQTWLILSMGWGKERIKFNYFSAILLESFPMFPTFVPRNVVTLLPGIGNFITEGNVLFSKL